MRQEEFKMERTGLVEIGQVIPITEGKLPNSYYYTLGKAYARCKRNGKGIFCNS